MYPFYKHFRLFTAERDEDGYRLRILQGEVDFDEQRSRFDFAGKMLDYSSAEKIKTPGVGVESKIQRPGGSFKYFGGRTGFDERYLRLQEKIGKGG